jgi:predicted chitinase
MDVTYFVRQMYNDPANAHGFMCKQQTESYYRRMVFASSNVTNPNHHPKLVIIYEIASNIEISGDSIVCNGDSTTLRATGASNYQWVKASAPNPILSSDDSLRVSPATY